MAFRYVMVDYNKVEDVYELYCYEGDDCIWEQNFDTQQEAQAYGNRYLDGEFKKGFDVEEGVPA